MTPNRKLTTQLFIYFILTFIIAWGTWFPSFLHPQTLRLLAFIGLFAPAISAVIVTYSFSKGAGIKRIFGRYGILKFKIGWYLVSAFLIQLLFIFSLGFDNLFFHVHVNNLLFPQTPVFTLVSFIWLMIINSGEEIGWRGFALPKLQTLLKSPFYSSLIVGIFWSIWHLPIYLVPGQSSIPLPVFLFFTIGLSLIYTVVFNQTNGSLFSVVLLHASTDIVPRIFDITLFQPRTWLIFGILVWVSAILLFILVRKSRIRSLQTS